MHRKQFLVLPATITLPALSMADEVADHERMAKLNELAHLSWPRIDGHYVLERIGEWDSASTCALTVEPRKAFEAFCPTSREIAQNLLRHFDP